MTEGEKRCGLASLLPMSCRGRAEAFARRLHSRLRSLGSHDLDDTGDASENSWLASSSNSSSDKVPPGAVPTTGVVVTSRQPRHNSDPDRLFMDFSVFDAPGSPEEELAESEFHKFITNATDDLNDHTHHNNLHLDECSCITTEPKFTLPKRTSSVDSNSSDGLYFDPENTEVEEDLLLSNHVNGLPLENEVFPDTKSISQEEENDEEDDDDEEVTEKCDAASSECTLSSLSDEPTMSLTDETTESFVPALDTSPTSGWKLSFEPHKLGTNNNVFGAIDLESLKQPLISSLNGKACSTEECSSTNKTCCPAIKKSSSMKDRLVIEESSKNCLDLKVCPSLNECLPLRKCASTQECPLADDCPSLGEDDSDKFCSLNSLNDLEDEDESYCSHLDIQHSLTVECPETTNPVVDISTLEISDSRDSERVEEMQQEAVNEGVKNGMSYQSHLQVEDADHDVEERIPRVRRCSSLKTGKTPPGTPGRKKIVRFADVLGLDLADVRTFMDEIPKVPISAFEDLPDADFSASDTSSLSSSPRVGLPAHPTPTRTLVALFQQPGGEADFLERVRAQQVCLENAVLSDPITLSVKGTIRVRNLDFNKSVHVRYSIDSWRSYADLQATYVPNSCDGFSDKFSFTLYAHTVPVGQRLEFAVRFQCRGCQHWDNNRGENYVFQCLTTCTTTPYLPITEPSWAGAAFY